MGTIVIHAGMAKAGSSSIQTWLAREAGRLRERGARILTARAEATDAAELEEFRGGGVLANAVVHRHDRGDGAAVLGRFFEQLDAAAGSDGTAVISGEALEVFLSRPESAFLDGLDGLAAAHRVRVAYYVRPQHTAYEAAWRQWGFRSGRSPSQFLHRRARALDYETTLAVCRRAAPRASFELRPFVPGLAAWEDPATNFARHFLGVEDGEGQESPVWENRGLSLEVANVLRHAPPGMLWSAMHDSAGIARVKDVLGEVEWYESQAIADSREVLRAYCRQRFEPGNARLIAEHGWSLECLVPAGAHDEDDPDELLARLDELWRPSASAAELRVLYAALAAAVARRQRPGSRGPSRGRRPPSRRARVVDRARRGLSAAVRRARARSSTPPR